MSTDSLVCSVCNKTLEESFAFCPLCGHERPHPADKDPHALQKPATATETRVGFSTPSYFNPVSWLVRKFTASKASHAFFVYHDVDFDMDMVMEAHELGFRLTPLRHFEKYNHIVKLVRPKNSIDEGLKFIARRYLGSMYDFAGLLGMSVVMTGRFFKRKWQNPFRGSKSVYCSESVILAMKCSPGYEKLDVDPDSSPQDLYEYFEKIEGA